MTKVEIHISKQTCPVELANSGGLLFEPIWTLSREWGGKHSPSVIFSSAPAALSAADQLVRRARQLGLEAATVIHP